MIRLATRRVRKNRGSLLLEVVVCVGLIAIVMAAMTSSVTGGFRVLQLKDIEAANLGALETETQRLRSLPLSAYYAADGVTLRPSITYYRALSLPGSGVAGKVYSRITLATQSINMPGGPVQVVITAQAVYLAGTVSAEDGIGSATGSLSSKTPSGTELSTVTETQTFVVL